jgi:hypothetical protein
MAPLRHNEREQIGCNKNSHAQTLHISDSKFIITMFSTKRCTFPPKSPSKKPLHLMLQYTLYILLLLRSLYILSVLHITAVFISCHFRPSNSDFGYIEEGESTAGYTFTPCVGSFACPGIDTQVQGISVLRLIQRTRQSR